MKTKPTSGQEESVDNACRHIVSLTTYNHEYTFFMSFSISASISLFQVVYIAVQKRNFFVNYGGQKPEQKKQLKMLGHKFFQLVLLNCWDIN